MKFKRAVPSAAVILGAAFILVAFASPQWANKCQPDTNPGHNCDGMYGSICPEEDPEGVYCSACEHSPEFRACTGILVPSCDYQGIKDGCGRRLDGECDSEGVCGGYTLTTIKCGEQFWCH